VFAVTILSHFLDHLDVDDGRPMHADEAARVKRSVEGAEQRPMQVGCAVAGVEFDVHAIRFDPSDLVHRNQPHTMGALQENLVEDRSARGTDERSGATGSPRVSV
jgi:hypothetical protein